jgi:sulfur relay (sulfurtransferase) DsrF/TusC family protein
MDSAVKTVLIILTQNDQSQLNVNESLAALMLFASFNIKIHILFKDAALSLLRTPALIDSKLKQFIKPGYKMVESFEFYDIEQFYILQSDAQHALLTQPVVPLQSMQLNSLFLQQFDHVITW